MHLRRCIRTGYLEYPEFNTATTASLSQLTLTLEPFQFVPQSAQARVTGISSLIVIWYATQVVAIVSPEMPQGVTPNDVVRFSCTLVP